MLGTRIHESSFIEEKYKKSCETTKLLRAMGHFYRNQTGCSYNTKRYQWKDRQALKKCVELSKQFRIVSLDDSVKRMLKTRDGNCIKARLVFSCNLPLKTITTHRVKGENGKEYEVKAQTPLPTKECLQAIREHKGKFDQLALWWVPNEITIDEVKELDPILVGKIETNFHGSICFELHRWVDENFEAEYWNKEAY